MSLTNYSDRPYSVKADGSILSPMWIVAIPTWRIALTPAQRQSWTSVQVARLAQSIGLVGHREPIIVAPDGDCYRVISGVRRYLAIEALRLDSCCVYDHIEDKLAISCVLYQSVRCYIEAPI